MEELYPPPSPQKPNRSQIQGHCAVGLAGSDKGALTDLKNKLVDLALNHSKIGVGNVRVPQSVSSLQMEFDTLKKGTAYLSWADYTALCKNIGLPSLHILLTPFFLLKIDANSVLGIQEDSIEEITTILHDVGSVVWHNVPNLRDAVIIDPQWLADAMAGVVSFICQASVARAGGMIDWSKMQESLKLK